MKKSFFPIVCTIFLMALLMIKLHKTADILQGYWFSPQNGIHRIKHNLEIIVATPTVSETESEFMARRRHMEQAIRKRLDQDAIEAESLENSKISSNHLIEIFKQITPKNAAEIIEKMNDEQIIKLLSMMDTQSAAAILTQIDADKAAKLTEKLLKVSQQGF